MQIYDEKEDLEGFFALFKGTQTQEVNAMVTGLKELKLTVELLNFLKIPMSYMKS